MVYIVVDDMLSKLQQSPSPGVMSHHFSTTLCHLLTLFAGCLSLTTLDLGKNPWTVSNAPRGIRHEASVPGSVYTDLLPQSGKLSPLYRDNDVAYKWIGRSDWNYTSTFYVPDSVLHANEISLVCEGLDTVATVFINGRMVGQSGNMFVRSTFGVKDVIKAGNNSVRVQFKSAVTEAAARANLYAYPVPPQCPPDVQHGECHVNLVRKEQCSFSWDWGPSFPTAGIWKPIYLNAFDSAILTSLSAYAFKANGLWVVVVETVYDVTRARPKVKGQLQVAIKELGVRLDKAIEVTSASNKVKVNLTLPKDVEVPLWWPRGYGAQKLFNLSATFTPTTPSSSTSNTDNTTITSRFCQIGFRTVELIQDPVSSNSSKGLTFYVKINGLPVFLKGSNWIPADNFQEKITPDRIRYLLQSAADVGMNAMRVWGGGIYESDLLYNVADQLGIMIWQDLMFSVAMYPGKGPFLDSVAQEVQQQVARLKHHPCIIVWAGSNENEKALRQNWFGTASNYSLYYQDFVRLYVTTIQPVVLQEDTSRPYLVSSPTDGAESVKEGYVASDPGSQLYGDIHYYDYLADQWDPSVFRVPRAATEYGIQSWCDPQSLAAVFEEGDYDLDGAMAAHRQHHALGNVQMAGEIGLHMRQPSSSEKKTKFLDFIYLSQINQAMSMRTQTEHYRRHQSQLLPDGRGLTMAALYWQLNDIWQAPTWASIDYNGRWKMLHYFAKGFFSPTLVSPYLDKVKDTVNVYMVVDEIPVKPVRDSTSGSLQFRPMTSMSEIVDSCLPLASTFKWMNNVSEVIGGKVVMTLYNYDSFTPKFTWNVPYQLKTSAESVFETSVTSLLAQSGCPSREDCLLRFSSVSHQGHVTATSWMTLTYPKDARLRPANVTIKAVSSVDAWTNRIDLVSNTIALYVWVSTTTTSSSSLDISGRFSDNGFPMFTPTASIYFHSQTPTSAKLLKDSFSVKSIVDVV